MMMRSLAFISLMIFLFPSHAFAANAYVSNARDNTISVIDLASNKVVTNLPAGALPHGLTLSLEKHFLYVTNSGSATVSIFDISNNQKVSDITVGSEPQELALTPDQKSLLVTAQDANKLVFINTDTNSIENKLSIPSANPLALDAAHQLAIVGSQEPDRFGLVLVNLAKKTIKQQLSLIMAPTNIKISPDGNTWYVTLAGVDAIEAWDANKLKLIKRIPTAHSPYAIAFTHNGQQGLATSQTIGVLYIFNTKTNKITHKIPVGDQPHAIAISPDDKFAYVVNEASNDVSVVDLATKKIVSTIAVGNGPRDIVIG